jgi:hypothetical protein
VCGRRAAGIGTSEGIVLGAALIIMLRTAVIVGVAVSVLPVGAGGDVLPGGLGRGSFRHVVLPRSGSVQFSTQIF